jgi:hypothetical protein
VVTLPVVSLTRLRRHCHRWFVLQIERNHAYVINRSVAVDDNAAPLVRLPKLIPGHLAVDEMEDVPNFGELEHTEVGQVPPSCPHTLAEIGGWIQRAPFWGIAVAYNEPQLLAQAPTVGDLRSRLMAWLFGRLPQQ